MGSKIQKIMPLIIKVIEQPGWTGTCFDMAAILGCTHGAAARNLHALRMEEIAYVCGWERKVGGHAPIFARRWNNEKDAPRLSKVTNHEKYARALQRQGKPSPRVVPRRGPEVWTAPPKQSLGIWGL